MRLFKRKSKWIEPTNHDIGILPGGQVIHYSVCWCKAEKKAEKFCNTGCRTAKCLKATPKKDGK